MTAPKSTNAIINKRVNEVYDLLLMGFSRAQIIEYGQKEDPETNDAKKKKQRKIAWNVTDAAIDTYIAKANEVFRQQSAVIRDEEFGKSLSRLVMLFQKCMTIQDYKTAHQVQREINLLLGLYPPKENKLNINIAIIQQFIAIAQAKGYEPTEIIADFIAELTPLEIEDDTSNPPD